MGRKGKTLRKSRQVFLVIIHKPLLILAAALPLAVSRPAPAQLAVARPNYGVPEFAEPGGVFHSEVKAAAGLAAASWKAVLVNDLRSWTGVVERAAYGRYVDNGTLDGYRLAIRVPRDISPEVFKLAISHASAGAATNRNAVSVVRNIETNFYFLHYADPQARAYEPTNPDTGKHRKHGSIREILWHAPALGLIHPRFVFSTGDEMDNSYGVSAGRYNEYIEAMCRHGVPVLATRGNNDNVISTADWRSTIGVETYSIRMGSFYIWQKDVIEDAFKAWFTNDYASSFTNPAVRYRLLGQHFCLGAMQAPFCFLPPPGQYPDLMLVGHGHTNKTIQSSPYHIIESGPAFDKGWVGFFEFLHDGSGWTCTTMASHPSSTWFQVMNTGAVAMVNSSFAAPNDGSCFTNAAAIVNGLPFTFRDGRLRFLMKYSAAGYGVANGEKLAEYDYNGRSNMAVVVKVNIARSATTRVSIRPLRRPATAR